MKIYADRFGHMTKIAAMPIYDKAPLKSFPEPVRRLPLNFVWSIGDTRLTNLVQMMVLGWPWPT